ncbi:MAG: hypothetical protein ACI87O_001139 [Planctomycetota bacterium]|jgi:hypothetical protein
MAHRRNSLPATAIEHHSAHRNQEREEHGEAGFHGQILGDTRIDRDANDSKIGALAAACRVVNQEPGLVGEETV